MTWDNEFESATAVRRGEGESTFHAELSEKWTVAGHPNGGYLQAIAARAAEHHSPHPDVIAASTNFLRAPGPGAVELTTTVLASGRSTTSVRVALSQNAELRFETVVTFGILDAPGSGEWRSRGLPPTGRPYEECPRVVLPPDSFPVALLETVDLHLEPESTGFVRDRPRGLGELRGWLDLPGGAEFDPFSLLFASDVMPPATFDIAVTGWVPTLQLSTYIRARPTPGPVQISLVANLVQGGRVDETCVIRDAAGAIVAQSHQLAAIRLPIG